ncbi:MAG TPA: phytanoyl-CoA dioxygenase family protein [Fimbriimonadaceae bacterium]|nr:phytanoyl-CoA dioxygenase family protein [Fimbriimonadaceae bacterium]
MALKAEQSLNARAEARSLPAWASWPNGEPPAGYFRLPMTEAADRFYKEQGFLVIEDGLSPKEIEELKHESAAICKGERGDVNGFLPGAPGESDDDAMRRYLCIHFPHKISPLMEGYLGHPAIAEVLTHVIGPNVKCMQSMLFIKSAGKPGQPWHQDEIYIPTRDRSLAGAWIAMDDATVENGCLWVIPRSAAPGILYRLEHHNDRRFDCGEEAQDFPYTEAQAVPVEVKAGSIVFFNGYLLHRSLPNYANAGYRRSLVNHYMSAESFLPWYSGKFPEGEYGAIADHRDIVLIAGKDPYAYKGIKSINTPHVRPTGEGGCGRDGEAKTKK